MVTEDAVVPLAWSQFSLLEASVALEEARDLFNLAGCTMPALECEAMRCRIGELVRQADELAGR